MPDERGRNAQPNSPDHRWQAVRCRDAGAAFIYAVRTTRIYCRPDCPARRPHPENVVFFEDSKAAEAAGFRPCKRCRPQLATTAGAAAVGSSAAAAVEEICRLLESAPQPPTLTELADRAGWSVHHLQRTFKSVTGLSPRDYARAQRLQRVRAALATDVSITEAIHAAGYGSSGRFYSESKQVLGMAPQRYRAGGAGERVHFAVGLCSLGSILVGATGQGICEISLGDDPQRLLEDFQARFARAELVGGEAAFEQTMARAIAAVEHPRGEHQLPLDLRGSAFQKRVWMALRDIPAGQTRSYLQVAESLGTPTGARAVAKACASNTVAVAIPCHRVVRSDGALAGYRWGIARKQALLTRERDAGV